MTLGVARSYIQPDTDQDDEVIATLIRWASSQVREYTGRLFTRPPVTEQRGVYFREQRSLRLDDPLENVTEIIAPINYFVDGEPLFFAEALTPDRYELLQRPTGTTLRLDAPGDGRFDITGEWGWDTIPGTIEQAVVVSVDEWYRGNVLPSTGGREEGAAEGKNISLPREVKEMLDPWTLLERIA